MGVTAAQAKASQEAAAKKEKDAQKSGETSGGSPVGETSAQKAARQAAESTSTGGTSEALRQAELHGLTTGGQFKESLSQQRFDMLSPAVQKEYNRQAAESQRARASQQAIEERKEAVKENFDEKFAREYEAGKGLDLAGNRIDTGGFFQGTEEEYQKEVERIEKHNILIEKHNQSVEAEQKKYNESFLNIGGATVPASLVSPETAMIAYQQDKKRILKEGRTDRENLNKLLSSEEYKGAEIDIMVGGKVVKTTSGERAYLDIVKATYQSEGEVTYQAYKTKSDREFVGKLLAQAEKEKSNAIYVYSPLSYKIGPKFGEPNIIGTIPLEKEAALESLAQYQREKKSVLFGVIPSETKLHEPGKDSILTGIYEGTVKNVAMSATTPLPIVSDILGNKEQQKETSKQIAKYEEKMNEIIQPGPTLIGTNINQILTGQPLTGTGRGVQYDIGTVIGDVALAIAPMKKIPGVGLKFVDVPGVSAKAASVTVGFGTKTKPVISFAEGRIMLGKPKFIEPITAEATTKKQLQRGIKLAADSSKLEQQVFTDVETIKKIENITPLAVERAENINKIIKLAMKAEEKIRSPTAGVKPFELIKEEETPSLMKSFKKQQEQIRGSLGPYEGSLSQRYTLLGEYQRQAGDFDFSLKSYETAAKHAEQTAKEIIPAEGREFAARINPKLHSAKVDVIEKNKPEKVGEFLNPKETDESGVSQAITGDTLFGRKIPSESYIVEEGKTFGLKRQLLKKGESIFSLQKIEGKLELEPVYFRKTQDVSDFFGIGKTTAANLAEQGMIKEAGELGKELDIFKQLFKEVNIKKSIAEETADITTLTTKPSLGESILSSPTTASVAKASPGLGFQATKTPFSVESSSGKSQTKKSPYKSLEIRSPYKSLELKSPYSLGSKTSGFSLGSKPSLSKILSSGSRPASASSTAKSIGQKSSLTGSKSSLASGASIPLLSPLSPLNKPMKSPPGSPPKLPPLFPPLPPPKIPPLVGIPLWKTTQRTKGKEPFGTRYDFLGGVPVSRVEGIYKERDITYGQKRINRLLGKEEAERKGSRSLFRSSKSKGKKIRLF